MMMTEREIALVEELDRVVAWLRSEARLCDCFARDEGECGCGAWGLEPGERSFKRAYIEDIADAIERHEHRGPKQ